MKFKMNLFIVLGLICILFIFSGCLLNRDTNISNIDRNSNIVKTKKPTINNEKKIENDVVFVLNNYKFNLSKSFGYDLLKNLDANELSFLRNSIYAKYGYTFSAQKYIDYFSQFSWYSPTSKHVESKLNSIDKQNIRQIIALEKELMHLKFKSSKLGFSLVFPKSWKDKYRIEESDMGIVVYFKPKEKLEYKCGEFFSIINTTSPNFNENFYDAIGDNRYFEANNIKYFIGGPTDFAFPDDHPESKTFSKMNLEVADILKTLEQLK